MSETPKQSSNPSAPAAPVGAPVGQDPAPNHGAPGVVDDDPPPKRLKPTRKTVIAMVLIFIVGALVILWAWRLWPLSSAVVTTENAYVRGQVTVLAPQVNGYVTKVLVKDFDKVRANQPLFHIDDRIYRQQLHQAEGQLAAARADLANWAQSLSQGQADLDSRSANLFQAQAELARAEADLARAEELAQRGSVSLRERDQVRATERAAEASVRRARANIRIGEETVKSTRVSRESLEAKVAQAEAQVELARINLANTIVVAPSDGQVSEASVRPGQYVTAGSQLLFLVPHRLWVVANFKETQTRRILVGQPASFTVDALGGARLTGRVEQVAPATGSEFSVLRPDNASGNFTKVVQRIPIRIAVNPDQRLISRLRAGMSVVAKVDTTGAPDPKDEEGQR